MHPAQRHPQYLVPDRHLLQRLRVARVVKTPGLNIPVGCPFPPTQEEGKEDQLKRKRNNVFSCADIQTMDTR